MYDYKETISPVKIDIPNVDIVMDTLPILYPYCPRICDRQAHFLIWWGTKETDPDIYIDTLKNKDEEQWVTCKENWKLEKGIAMLHIYEKEIILGGVKTSGVLRKRPKTSIRKLIRQMYSDIVNTFPHYKIIIPTGTYMEQLHLVMNQMRIQKEPYHREIMQQFGFKKQDKYYIRYGNYGN